MNMYSFFVWWILFFVFPLSGGKVNNIIEQNNYFSVADTSASMSSRWKTVVCFLQWIIQLQMMENDSSRMKWKACPFNTLTLSLNSDSNKFWRRSSHYFLFLISSLLIVFLCWAGLAIENGNMKFIELFSDC